MTAYEYEITSGTPYKTFWLLLPHPILVRKGQFILIDAAHRRPLSASWARNITLIGPVTIDTLDHGWYEVRDTQTTPPFAPFAGESAAEDLDDLADDRSMAGSAKKRRKRIG